MTHQDDILLKPAMAFAFLKTLPLVTLGLTFLFLAWQLSPYFVVFAIATTGIAWYRVLFLRSCEYRIGREYIQITTGIFFKRIDQVEMYRIKDYVITRSLLLQLFRLMDVILKSTDSETPVVWLRGIPLSDIIETIRERVQEARKVNKIVELN
ncbi:PH domain-containing protein [Mucilaginibacter sp. SMC90]|uniref:PH domain-containing protein n=1 Tax=Mucilaginibacter sp. SMC90 TaxID=2929803 RepID=UPI001FB561AA|nr:PH domain-containing protein [Mucilaginibacter sp. SMC90]UOE52596.1 PH domain-containing protein [Mucilaginibacter sp. SMC90]